VCFVLPSFFFGPMGGGVGNSIPGYTTGQHIPQCHLDMSTQLNYKSRKVMLSL